MTNLLVTNFNGRQIVEALSELDLQEINIVDFIQRMEHPTWMNNCASVVVVIDGDSLLYPLASTDLLKDLIIAIKKISQTRPNLPVLVSSLVVTHQSPFGFADISLPDGHFAQKLIWNQMISELGRECSAFSVLELEPLIIRANQQSMAPDTYWYLGRIRYGQELSRRVAVEIRTFVSGLTSSSKKLLLLDLDNTLWGGVLAEDGPDNLKLSEDGQGKAFRDFQRILLALKRSGILLAAVTKNDHDKVLAVLDSHPMMVLKSHDFVSISADWTPKVNRIRELAKSLNLDTSSMVFVDDSMFERQGVIEALPDVIVPDFPIDPTSLPEWFLNTVIPTYFNRLRLSAEDLEKTTMYQQGIARTRAQRSSDAELHFINSLQIELSDHWNDASTAQRIAQLSQKTNQFNACFARYSVEDVASLISQDKYDVVGFSYADRFGKEGLIGAVTLDCDSGSINEFVLSCRILGRGVEERIMKILIEWARQKKLMGLQIRFKGTQRNTQVLELLKQTGFQLLDEETATYMYNVV
ncbi:MAG: HAD-IIIC family phosphatase [Betaproteobacteria bacterium]|nr:HAD-IIIC family phosphatase [Betaproteobacteria bacterium]